MMLQIINNTLYWLPASFCNVLICFDDLRDQRQVQGHESQDQGLLKVVLDNS